MNNSSECDQLEEGEIVDEDDFEAISDTSISESGKCVPQIASSRAPHLSSDQRNWKRKKKRKRIGESPPDTSDSSGNEAANDFDMKSKLKEAIHIDLATPCCHKNNLQTRLRGMSGSLPSGAPLSQTDDTELEALRIEALKTAVMNKMQKRKKKKELEIEQQPVENKDSNKENEELKDAEEDPDLLRASLLAGMANKKVEPKPVQIVPFVPNTVNNQSADNHKISHVPRTVQAIEQNALIVSKPLPVIKPVHMFKTKVKPLIIRVNDSESEDDEDETTTSETPSKDLLADFNTISNSVERFLKEQRAKFESQNRSKQSALKLLPKSQQIEYKQLVEQLKAKRAQKRQRSVKSSIKPPVQVKKCDVVNTKPVVKAVVSVKKVSGEETRAKEDVVKTAGGTMANDLTLLRKILKDIKLQTCGSLQIKTEYQVLTSIIKKITMTNSERKMHEANIKKLNAELAEANRLLAKSHSNFSELVKELVFEKQSIDRRIEFSQASEAKKLAKSPEKGSEQVIARNNECVDMDVCDSEDDSFQIDIVDPNDIDQIYAKKLIVPSSIPEYVSPLNPFARYTANVDPLGVMCPYEVNGLCRDVECQYIHYAKVNGHTGRL